MKNFDQLQQETQAAQFGFLITDADTALIFLDVARTTRNDETRARNRENAAVAYATVQKFRARVVTTEQQDAELDEKLDRVQQELASFENPQPVEI